MKLFARERHEPLAAEPWDEQRARDTIARIVDTAVCAFDERALWPAHPRDGDVRRGPHKTIYDGAAGVLAALAMLDAPFDLANAAEIVHRAWRRAPDAGRVPSLFLGATGVELVRWALTDKGDLEAPIAANVDHPAREIMWGAPGTMLAALHLWQRTADDRWHALYRASADALSSRWWTQELWGDRHEMLGACHGAAGALFALLLQRSFIEPATDLLERTALRDGELVNWPADARERRAELVQWCHGAPGIITSLGIVERGTSPRLDELLEAGGELVWRAGPLRKGPSLCHGTSGNGEAFLTLYRRSGEARWLERARAFAMHAIGQYESTAAPWFSLWTGDLGVALYLRNCLDAAPGLPLIERFISR